MHTVSVVNIETPHLFLLYLQIWGKKAFVKLPDILEMLAVNSPECGQTFPCIRIWVSIFVEEFMQILTIIPFKESSYQSRKNPENWDT